ncbi:uncharacterized protein IL334_007212 [Kwoniella shivajii]|uniref:Ribosomal protein S11 n=1 Tax=Kwoniella shivajii TaxID=564305 RepID=A0ABZ1D9E4_9TREE|nr:hypothetical protein IL334_007212 [Kwoniella shivajii]
MASIIRSSSAINGVCRLARPAFIATAGFASSSRHGLDFTRPLFNPSPAKPTILIEQELSSISSVEPELSTESHETPSTSKPSSSSKLTPQPTPSPKTVPTPKLHTPQFSTPTPAPKSRKGKNAPGPRFMVETDRLGGDRQNNPTHTLHIKSTRNNVVLSLTDGMGPVFSTVSGGSDKIFKNSQRSSYEAATQAATKMFEKILEWNRSLSPSNKVNIRVAFNGMFGMGREAISSALAGPEGQELRSLITRVEDRTKIKIGGTRAPKPRRL